MKYITLQVINYGIKTEDDRTSQGAYNAFYISLVVILLAVVLILKKIGKKKY